MGLFGCSHRWRKLGKARDGAQQQRCTRCGRVRNIKVSQLWCFHTWRKDGRPKRGVQVMRCQRCGKTREGKVSQRWCIHRWRKNGRAGVICARCGLAYNSGEARR